MTNELIATLSSAIAIILAFMACLRWFKNSIITQIEQSLYPKFSRIDLRSHATDDRLERIEAKISILDDSINDGFEELQEELSKLSQRLQNMHEDMIYVDNDLNNMEEKIIQLEYRPNGGQSPQPPIQPMPQAIRRMRRRRGL